MTSPRRPGPDPAPLTAAERAELLRLVREALTEYLDRGEVAGPRTDSPALLRPRAAFVTLRRRGTGELRGCRGETRGRDPLLASAIRGVIAAATDDPRFDPVTPPELPTLRIEISALTVPRRIAPEAVEVGRHGLLIARGPARGLLLPKVPHLYGLADRFAFLDALCRKAGLRPGAWADPATTLYAFEAEEWGEPVGPDAGA